MEPSQRYFYGKLVGINYDIATHVGDANRRLASEAQRILNLFPSEAPEKYRKEFEKLWMVVEKELKDTHIPGLKPVRIKGIRNSTASKYIKMLIDMEREMRDSD